MRYVAVQAHRMMQTSNTVVILAILSAAGCAASSDVTYRRMDGTVVTVAPCEDGDTMCLDILDTNLVLNGSTVEEIDVAALLRGPFDENSEYVYGGANLVQPQYVDDANDSYGALTRVPLALQFVPGEDRWQSGHVVHFIDAGTDGSTLLALCTQTVFSELSLGAPAQVNNEQPMSSTTWLKDVSMTCH